MKGAASARLGRVITPQWLLALGAGLLAALVLVLIFLLVSATNNHLLYERYYQALFWLNVVVAAALALAILGGFWSLLLRWRKGKFGSHLLLKLAAIFGLVGVLPGVLIYVVSYQFVSRSIESWFDIKVEGALTSGLTLARTSLETQARDFGHQLRVAAQELADTPDALAALPLEQLRQNLGATDVVLWSASGRLIASAGQSRFDLGLARPSAAMQRQVRENGVATQLEGLDEADAPAQADAEDVPAAAAARMRALVAVRTPSIGLTHDQRLLEAVQPLPATLVAHALAVQAANREYQERALGRTGLRRMYIGTLTLSLVLAVLGAVLLAALLGRQLARPLLMLAEGMQQVAAGDLRPRLALQGRDELQGLTRSFAEMTRQLSDARQAVTSGMRQVEAARAYLQTILDSLTAGVIVLDKAGRIQSANPSAQRILGMAESAGASAAANADANAAANADTPAPGVSAHACLHDLPHLADFAASVQGEFEAFEASDSPQHHWQKPFELHGGAGGGESGVPRQSLSLLARGAALPGGQRLLVFDDISELVSAQRAQAWAEVARRLAHEIKNPLTPIQLSAQRLEHKLAARLADADRALLVKSVNTIVEQVAAMQRLVNEFRDYARLPSADLKPLDLNALIAEVMNLYADGGHGRVRLDADAQCPPILGDAQQLRQVIHNLVQNAQDATEQAAAADGRDLAQCTVGLRTQWQPALRRVRMTVTDQGTGFAEVILKRAFEPYITTKAKGTGLGLAVVKKIADEHRARIEIANCVQNGKVAGAQVSLSFEAATDQAQPTAVQGRLDI